MSTERKVRSMGSMGSQGPGSTYGAAEGALARAIPGTSVQGPTQRGSSMKAVTEKMLKSGSVFSKNFEDKRQPYGDLPQAEDNSPVHFGGPRHRYYNAGTKQLSQTVLPKGEDMMKPSKNAHLRRKKS